MLSNSAFVVVNAALAITNGADDSKQSRSETHASAALVSANARFTSTNAALMRVNAVLGIGKNASAFLPRDFCGSAAMRKIERADKLHGVLGPETELSAQGAELRPEMKRTREWRVLLFQASFLVWGGLRGNAREK